MSRNAGGFSTQVAKNSKKEANRKRGTSLYGLISKKKKTALMALFLLKEWRGW